MKKLWMLFVVVCSMINANAQVIRSEELRHYAKQMYGSSWTTAARNIAAQYPVDLNNALTYVRIIQAPDRTKDQLFNRLNYWYTQTFNEAHTSIEYRDRMVGQIIAKGYCGDITEHSGVVNDYMVSIHPIIKTDVKDNKVRVTLSVPYYDVWVMSGTLGQSISIPLKEKWEIGYCYPYARTDSHKKTSSKALVMTNAYAQLIMSRIEAALKGGIFSNETDNW